MAVRRQAVLDRPRKARRIALVPAADMAAARRAVLREGLDQLLGNMPGVLAGRDPEFLHQLRVGMRRLRAALHVFGGTMRAADVRALRKALRRIARVAGPARDWDVCMRRLQPKLRPAAARRRRAAYVELRRVLRAPRSWLVPRGRSTPRLSLRAFARAALGRARRKSLSKGERIDWTHAGRRHALRVRLRRLRYACEFLRGAFPERDSKPLIDSLKRLQDLLGDLNDLEIARRLRAQLPATPTRSGAQETRLLAQLPAAWRAFAAAPRFWQGK